MAAINTICIACGADAVPGCRAAANDISTMLKSQLSRRCRDMDIEVDLDAVISRSYACRKCTKVYQSHMQKDDRLYQATANSINYVVSLQSCNPVNTTPRKRAHSEVGIASKKRRITTSSNSPTVTVSTLYDTIFGAIDISN